VGSEGAGRPVTPLSAEVLREAAQRPHAPPRLLRAADAVLDGRFTWDDVAGGRCEHPFAQSLFTPRAEETLWPYLREVADELAEPRDRRAETEPAAEDDEEDFSLRTYRR
jgi:hypothetical protein